MRALAAPVDEPNKRRNVDMKSILSALALAGLIAMPAVAQDFGPPELIAAAKKEGWLVYYTANFAEVEQEVIKAFNKRFPEIKVEMVRAPGGQLITRVKTEAAAGKLAADVVDHSDRALMRDLVGLFQDYAPPNGKDYLPDSLISPKRWPRATLVWSIAYNSALVKNPPKSWMDLTKPEYANKQIGEVIAPSGGHDVDARHVRASGLGRGLLEEAGGNQPSALSLWRADGGFARARRDHNRPAALQHRLHQEARWRAARHFLCPRRRPRQSLRQRRA